MSDRSVFTIHQRRAPVAWFGTAALLVVIAGPAAAAPVFSDGFEAGTPAR